MNDAEEKSRLYAPIDMEISVKEQEEIYRKSTFNFYRYFQPMANYRGVYNSTDEEGFRRTVQPYAGGNPSCKRILFFGGSTMWGVGAITDRDTIPSIFAEKINQFSGGAHYEVENCGVGGYVNAQEMIVLLERLGSTPVDCAIFLDGVNEVHMGWEELMFGENNGRFLRPSIHSGMPAIMSLIDRTWRFDNPKIVATWTANGKMAEAGGDLGEIELAQARRIVSLYRKNKNIIDALGGGFNFPAYFFLQPDLFTKPNLSPYERRSSYWKRLKFVLFSRAVYDLFRREFAGDDNFFDISTAISTEETIFLDDHHTTRGGNEFIADVIMENIARDIINGG